MTTGWKLAFWTCALAILILSLVPVTPELPTTGWDKSNHFLGFFVLTMLGLAAYPRRPVIVLAGLLLYGGLIEILQAFTTYRSAELADLMADGIGVAAAIGLRLSPRLFRRENRSD
jgi:LPXTG-motif cell wall-anchored protein